ncbi:putative IS transposase [Thermoanaerobacter ethanolicus JW 200]|uniref:hypothetical protein n=1 Tax=Thermoanaerobacter ethanolicus TaxID=1757 RepID=UPI000202BB83|nr:putative IS transposase [Thermoanaerobacter ethanolicus JW 200]
MKKNTPSFVLTLRLDTQKYQEDILNKRMEIARQIYNACLREAYKNYRTMSITKKYRELMANIQKEEDKEKLKICYTDLKTLKIDYNLTVSYMDKFVAPMQKKFKKNIDSHTAQKLAKRALSAVEKLIYGNAEKVNFKKYGADIALEGKNNKAGIRYKDGYIEWLGLKIPVVVKPNDKYAQLAIQSRVKYCRIIRKYIGNKYKYYVQLILEGIPPQKKNKDGTLKLLLGKGTVGIDPGVQTEAVVSDTEVKLLELAPDIENIDKKVAGLQRKLDRSRRATNPENFNEDGTVKKGTKNKWIKSKNYIKTLLKLKELNHKRKAKKIQSHNKLANYILSLGDNFIVEDMNYKALQKRKKETEINPKTGKYKSKKRFGKSILYKSPGLFLTILDRKLHYFNKELIKVSPKEIKASKYNHLTNTYEEKSLSERWNYFEYNGKQIKVQRDLYSAFLLQNVEDNKINREKCIEKFDNFLRLHDKEIERLRKMKFENNKKLLASMGI